MNKAHFVENVIEICTDDGSMEILLPYMYQQLELCQKSLTGYYKIYLHIIFYTVFHDDCSSVLMVYN